MKEGRRKQIRRAAADFRDRCLVGRYGMVDLFRECGKCNAKLIRYPLAGQDVLGFSIHKDGDIIIFTNTSVRLSREIFTLAHEIGHVVLHMEGAGEGAAFSENNRTLSDRSEDEREQEANYFAAQLLMPEEAIRKYVELETDERKREITVFDTARMMSEFGVSFEAILNRLESLNIISRDERLILDSRKNEKHVGNLLRCVGGNGRLNEPAEVIDIPYEYMEYAIFNFNHNAVPQETLEKVLAYYKLNLDDVSSELVIRQSETTGEDLDELIRGVED